MMEVVELKWGSRSFPDEDQEQGDNREPEFRVSKFPGAASADLHEESKPWQNQEKHWNAKRNDGAGNVEEVTSCLQTWCAYVHAYRCILRTVGNCVSVEIVVVVPDIAPKNSRDCKGRREKPDQWDEDGVWPRPWNESFLTGKVPLAIFHK